MNLNLYGRLVARNYDRWYRPAEAAGLAGMRERLLAGLAGRVLEVGAGTGLNLPHLPPAVETLVLLEPDELMVRQLRRRLDGRGDARIVRASAERLPFDDATFDAAITTFTLCTVESLERSLAEVRRVLRPGARLAFIEHVRAPEPMLARLQDRLEPAWRRIGYGCRCNRRTLDAIEAAGFAVGAVERGNLPLAVPIYRPYVSGYATRPEPEVASGGGG